MQLVIVLQREREWELLPPSKTMKLLLELIKSDIAAQRFVVKNKLILGPNGDEAEGDNRALIKLLC